MGDDGSVSVSQQEPQQEQGTATVRAAVSTGELSVDAALAAVRHRSAGAVSVFVGVVRDHDGGKEGVTVLDYSAHPDAATGLGRLAGEVARRPQVHGVVAWHRSGRLEVGDLAVVCAVSAEHRAEAFDACRELVERLKHEVPIWKHQEFADGTTQWVGL